MSPPGGVPGWTSIQAVEAPGLALADEDRRALDRRAAERVRLARRPVAPGGGLGADHRRGAAVGRQFVMPSEVPRDARCPVDVGHKAQTHAPSLALLAECPC